MGTSDANGNSSSSSLVKDFLHKCGGVAVIDGGFATELERHGADLNDPLWSAKCLFADPHLIRDGLDYAFITYQKLHLEVKLHEVVIDETLENYSSSDGTGRQNLSLQNFVEMQSHERGIEEEKGADSFSPPNNKVNTCELGKTIAEDNESQQIQLEMVNSEDIWDVQEIEPLITKVLTDSESRATAWVQQNLIKLHKMFGVDFQGLEEEALELLK